MVDWHDRARDRLADLWVAATPEERVAIERAVHEINARLATDPAFLGEEMRPGERVWFHHPLVVRYRLIPGGGVKVLHVARLRPWRPDADGDG